ncbi:hypothetical protein HOLleu_39266 [Holothuria leucospilota]|uniref:Uncharacterized protein n=1 Tax=Holothuria leucospilota TaxID=206669 RepID=A0A9Q0YFY7_HOLLE|nr:hypothetical protein HOLleu_39266 [Holothuria leucospilota]
MNTTAQIVCFIFILSHEVLVIGTLVIIKIRTPEPRGENIQDSFPHSNPLAPEIVTYNGKNKTDGNVGEDDDLLDLIKDVGRKYGMTVSLYY